MGADGGCKITPVSYIRNDWKKIKYSLISTLENELNTAVSDSFNDRWTRDNHPTYIETIKQWPDSVRFKTNVAIWEYLRIFPSCDCPYLFQGKYIVTAHGTNINELHRTLSECLPGDEIETWT